MSQHLILAQQLGNLIGCEQRLLGDPSLFKQWIGSSQAVADFRVNELAQTKMTALALIMRTSKACDGQGRVLKVSRKARSSSASRSA
jgi:hypothetical protein|tara:strand:- start:181 stop:441 length:261 start_codon:yes stop_codon:yes gene_type:complete